MPTARDTKGNRPEAYQRPRTRRPHWGLWILLIGVALLALAVLIPHLAGEVRQSREQQALQPFYETPAGFERAAPGAVLRSGPLDVTVPAGGQALRILYRSEREDGLPTVSSGMVFFPKEDADVPERPVVAWAHGTVGFGDACAPSRSANPLADMDWLGQMLSRGWVVVATDYAGLGTDGVSRYLIGGDEARDVLNSVRAARQIDPKTGSRFALFGHSQGGHSALWSANEAALYAPELSLVGTAAAAPAAELGPLFSQQYDSAAAWVIGPDVTISWPTAYPNLDLGIVTDRGLREARKIAAECAKQSGEGALVRGIFHEQYFKTDPVTSESWRQAADEQTPRSLPPNQPLLVVQSLTDQVVLPDTTARLVQRSCSAGSTLETLWLSGIAHQDTATAAGPTVVDWLGSRFRGAPAGSSCDQPLPVPPAS